MRFNTDSELLKGFNSQRREAHLYVNDSPTAVEVSYESANERTTDNDSQELNESSPYIGFNRIGENTLVESSNDGIEWMRSEEQEESQQIQILSILSGVQT
jgi:hypothetical protein